MFVLASFCQLFEEQNEKVKDKMVEERQQYSQSFLSQFSLKQSDLEPADNKEKCDSRKWLDAHHHKELLRKAREDVFQIVGHLQQS